MNAMVADRAVLKGDKITGMVVEGRYGGRVWAGEFSATYGDHRVSAFFGKSDLDKISFAYLRLEDGTIAFVDPYWAIRQE
jgi:hypothetical protein